jgi:hypothetical protein
VGGGRWVPFLGPRARGWPACCRQERGNLEGFPLRKYQIMQHEAASTGHALACLQKMCHPSSSPRPTGGFPRPCDSLQVLRGPRNHDKDTRNLPILLDFPEFWIGKWGQTHSCILSLSQPANSYASFNTQPSLFLSPLCPTRASISQAHVYQIERSTSYVSGTVGAG